MKFEIKGLEWLSSELKKLTLKNQVVFWLGLSPFLIFLAYIFIVAFSSTNESRCESRRSKFTELEFSGHVVSLDTISSQRWTCLRLSDGNVARINYKSLYDLDKSIFQVKYVSKSKGNDFIKLIYSEDIEEVIEYYQDCSIFEK